MSSRDTAHAIADTWHARGAPGVAAGSRRDPGIDTGGRSPQHAPCVRTAARRTGTRPWQPPRPTRHRPRRPPLVMRARSPASPPVNRRTPTVAGHRGHSRMPPECDVAAALVEDGPSSGELSADEPVPTKSMVPRNHSTLRPMNSAYSSLRLLGGPALRRPLPPVVAGSISTRERAAGVQPFRSLHQRSVRVRRHALGYPYGTRIALARAVPRTSTVLSGA